MSDLHTKVEKHRDALVTLANADCSASWIAQDLLTSVEGRTSFESKESEQSNVTANSEPNTDTTEPEGSVFAY